MSRGIGGEGGARGGRDPNAGGRADIDRGMRGGGDRTFSGAQMLNPRRTPVTSPSYEASLGNLAKLASRAIPGAGMVLGAGLDIMGARPGFTGFQGTVNTPGSYDPTNRALGQETAGGGLTGTYLDRIMQAKGMLAAQQQTPAPPPIAPQQIAPKTFNPQMLSTPGLMAYGIQQPGYQYY